MARRLLYVCAGTVCLALAAAQFPVNAPASQPRERPLPPEFKFVSDSLVPVMHDPARAPWVLERLRPILAKFPNHAPYRQIQFWAMANTGASAGALAALTDSLVGGVFPSGRREPPGRLQQATHCLELGQALFARRESLTVAARYLRRATQYVEPTHPTPIREACEVLLAQIGHARDAAPSDTLPLVSLGDEAVAPGPGADPGDSFRRGLLAVLRAAPGAFVGAFAAFFFYRLGDFALDRYRRKQRHHSALVRLEWLFNSYHTHLRFLVKRIHGFQKAAEHHALHRGRLRPLDIDAMAYLDLLDPGLINKLFEMNHTLKSVNSDIEDIMAGYQEARENHLAGRIPEKDFWNVAKCSGDDLDVMRREIEALQPEVERLHSWIRLQAKKDTPRMWVAVNTPRPAKVNNEEIEAEVARLKEEQEKSITDSLARRERIHGDQPAGGTPPA